MRKGCRYLKELTKSLNLCTKTSEKSPECEDCDVNDKYDALYENIKYQRLVRDSHRPYRAEQIYDWIQELVREGIVNVKQTNK